MQGGIPRGRYQTRGGEVSDARRYPAGKVYIRRAEVYQTRGEVSRGGGIPRGRYQTHGGIPRGRYQTRGEVADARRYQMRGAEGAYVTIRAGQEEG